MWFAVVNWYANKNSVGFYNTWDVRAFTTKKERDEFVENATDLATRVILRREIGRYLDRPKPFSGEAYCLEPIWDDGKNAYSETAFAVIVDTPEDGPFQGYYKRLNKRLNKRRSSPTAAP